MVSTHLLNYSKLTVLTFFLLVFGNEIYSQSWVAQNQQDGFILKKVVSDTTIATGQPFSYTIYFTIPAGATNVTITDALPASLLFLGHSVTSACGTPTVTVPTINTTGGTVSVNWAALPGGCTGSFTISVAFPNGVTCPGVSARNRVCLTGTLPGKVYEFCTPFVTTSATATNPWGIYKYPIGVAWQGGNCQYLTSSDTITYQVCVYKAVGTTGQLNLVNGVVRDTLPTGAVLLSSNCGATQSGNVITWNVGNMVATSMYNSTCCQFVVHFPIAQFPNGSTINNHATLSGSLGSPNQPCSNFSIQSNTTCVEKKSITSGTVSKWVYTNRQPGCSGQYLIYICNTGTTTINVNALDTLPTQLTGYSLGATGNLTANLSGGIITITGTLTAGQCGYLYVNFTIPQTATINSTITNCVRLSIAGNPVVSGCASFVVDTPAPKPCVWKEVCNKQTDYTPGSVFRYRLRIQNIGGQPIVGSSITDVLNPNLEYVGNPSSYISNSWNTPCTTTPSNPWNGVNISYNSGTNTITATLDTIPATCQNIFYSNCGMYGTGGVPYYFIEVDVKVKDTSALGSIPNSFSIGGGNLGTSSTISNVDYILVTGVVGYNLDKGVKKPSDANYATTALTNAGATVNYRLKMNSSGTAALRHVTIVDLLPMNNTTSDSKILAGCGTRGSQFNVQFNSLLSSSPAISSFWGNTASGLSNVNVLTPTGAPGAAFSSGCGTSGTWSSAAWIPTQMNLGAYLGSAAVGSGGATVEFDAKIANSAKPNETACNSFAVSGWTKHLIQSSVATFQMAGQLESPFACVTIDTVTKPKTCIEPLKLEIDCRGKDPRGNQQYYISLTANSCTPATLLISSPDGTFSPATFTFSSSPWTMNTTFTHNNANNPIKIIYTLICKNEICKDSIMRDLPKCDEEPPKNECCIKFEKKFIDVNLQHNSATGWVSLGMNIFAGPSGIKKFSATIVSAQLRNVCFNSTGAWTRIYGDITSGGLWVPPAAGPQLLSTFSREAVWGVGDCIDWTKGAKLSLDMVFPPYSSGVLCRDTLKFQIRYTFTDCECNTCDTLIAYTIVRKKQFKPWDWDMKDLHLSDLKDKIRQQSGFRSEQPNSTGIVMNNANDGDLWIISPDEEENDIHIIGAEIISYDVPLLSLSDKTNDGIIQGDVAYINLDIKRGQVNAVNLKFDNKSSLMQFPVLVRYIYTTDGNAEVMYTDQFTYLARIPNTVNDDLNIDNTTKPDKVRTYALYFNNKNGYKESISVIGLKPANNMKVLAVGPSNNNNESTYLIPRKQEDGTYIISTLADGAIGVDQSQMVKPIFVTLSGVPDENAVVDFTTYDSNAEIISTGQIVLTNPISKVADLHNGNGIGIDIQSIIPNPASKFVTVTLSSSKTISGVKISIVDALGREVISLNDNIKIIEQGQHINTVDVSNLTAGMYYFTIQTPDGIITKPLSVIR